MNKSGEMITENFRENFRENFIDEAPYKGTPQEWQKNFDSNARIFQRKTGCLGKCDKAREIALVTSDGKGCFAGDREWCFRKDPWNYSNKSKCCAGDPSVMYSCSDHKSQKACTDQGCNWDGSACSGDSKKFDIRKCANFNHQLMAGTTRWKGKDEVWAPFSESCLEDVSTIDYCSKPSVDGKSRLITDKRCGKWCNDMDLRKNGICDEAKKNYCKSRPEDPACVCMDPQNNKYYQEVIKAARDIGIQIPSGSPVCWLPACAGEDLVSQLYTTQMRNEKANCPGSKVNICQSVIDAKGAGKVNIADNTIQIACNQLAGGDSSSSSSSSSETGGNVAKEDDSSGGGGSGGGGVADGIADGIKAGKNWIEKNKLAVQIGGAILLFLILMKLVFN